MCSVAENIFFEQLFRTDSSNVSLNSYFEQCFEQILPGTGSRACDTGNSACDAGSSASDTLAAAPAGAGGSCSSISGTGSSACGVCSSASGPDSSACGPDSSRRVWERLRNVLWLWQDARSSQV